ncbi:MAG: hypothetical protein JO131_09665, partial [Gammaproteobacteria bacterium]|nr:hypothetical protein [Gammaproteobacteria bacterium]
MKTRKIDYCKFLLNSQQAYRKAAIFETFVSLNLHEILKSTPSIKLIAKKLRLNYDAFSRFMHATANLFITNKIGKKFVLNTQKISFNKDSSLALFWLINTKLPDFLSLKPLNTLEISKSIPDFNSNMLHLAEKNYLIIKNNRTYTLPESTKKYLISHSAYYIGDKIKHFEKIMFPMFSVKGITNALKTGKSQWSYLFNSNVSHPFKLYEDNPILLETFTRGMHQLNTEDDETIINQLHFKNITSALDIGGGSGAFSLKLLNKFYSINYIDIYELPQAVPLLKKILSEYSKNENRINYITGSFLEETKQNNLSSLSIEKKYDLIILGWILHDWNDATCINILRKAYNHLKSNKYLLILESLLPKNKVSDACQSDIAMLLQTEGKERTISEFKKLLTVSGFNKISVLKTQTKRQAILAKK